MSISFQSPVNNEALAALREMAAPTQHDEKTFLFNALKINQQKLKEIANKAGQPVTVEMNGEGDIKTMSDGSMYQVTESGWKKVI